MKIKFNIIAALLLLMGGVVFTACNSDGDDFEWDHSGLFLSGTENNPLVTFAVEDAPASYTITVQSTKKVAQDVHLTLAIDPTLVDAYNKEHTTNYFALDVSDLELENPEVVIAAGSALSSAATVRILTTENFKEGRTYMIPVTVKSYSGSSDPVIETSKTIYLRISRIINFFAIQANAGASSNYIFPDEMAIPLTTLTYEAKIYPQGLNRTNYPQRFMALEEKDESKSLLVRFNEANSDNKVQTILAGNRWISAREFENNQWYMLTWVFDGSTMSLYVNGELDSSIGGSIEGGVINFQRYEMGMSWGGYTTRQFFAHRFCEIRIWDRALTASEIKGGLCGVDPESDGLKAYWKFNEGSGYLFKDETGHGYDMDWSQTSRDKSENGNMNPTPEAANSIQWVKDDINKCVN